MGVFLKSNLAINVHLSLFLDAQMYSISYLNPVSMARSVIHPLRGVFGYAESLALVPFVAVLIPTVAFIQLCQDIGVADGSQKAINRSRTALSDAIGPHKRLQSEIESDDPHPLMSLSRHDESTDNTNRFDESLHLITHDVYDPVDDSGTSQSDVTSSFGSSSTMTEREARFAGPDISDEAKDLYETQPELEHTSTELQMEEINTDVPFEDGADSVRVYSAKSNQIGQIPGAESDYESFRMGHPIETIIRVGMDVEKSIEGDIEISEQRAFSDEHHVSAQGKQSKKNRKKKLKAKERAKETKKPGPEVF